MCGVDSTELPAWAQVRDKRAAHIRRVTDLLDSWADALTLGDVERTAWHAAGILHDALRDASEPELRALVPDSRLPAAVLHGPAAAVLLERDGETRAEVLEAIRHHTIGCAGWGRVGRALFMADYLEPGRRFARAERAFLASHVPDDFDDVFREVVRHRLAWTVQEGHELFDQTVRLWNSVR